jgi:hypothetical protein
MVLVGPAAVGRQEIQQQMELQILVAVEADLEHRLEMVVRALLF